MLETTDFAFCIGSVRWRPALRWCLAVAALCVCLGPLAAAEPKSPTGQDQHEGPPRIAFVGLHGGVFEVLQSFAGELGLSMDYLTDEQIHDEAVDLARYRLVFLQHARGEDRDHLQRLVLSAKNRQSELRVIAISAYSAQSLPGLAKRRLVETDPKLSAYYGSLKDNLRRMLIYINVTYLHRPGAVLPPLAAEHRRTIYHPDFPAPGLFPSVDEFLRWSQKRGWDVAAAPRAVVTVHSSHLTFQQPKVVDALVRALEKRGVLTAAVFDLAEDYLAGDYEEQMLALRPQVVIHTCHSTDSVAFRVRLGVPHMHSIFFRTQSIADWRESTEGLSASEVAFHITGQELLGAIEPQIGAGTRHGGGSDEAFTPIPERIDHLADRAAAWVRLARLPNAQKKVAFVYYDCDLGKSELMRGTATGMFMNGPRSMVGVLQRLKCEGYAIAPVPADENELVGWLMDRGRQIGIWAPGVLDRLARNGSAVLIPAEQYQAWFEAKVPEKQRQAVIQRWGPPPGKFLVWHDKGKSFIVIPRIDLGNVILLPQPLRGEAHDTALIHDKNAPPPHNYLATYFWLQKTFHADAVVHFGTHGTEFILPGKPTGLSDVDWPDIVLGAMPNINPWIIDNLGESSAVRRRAYAVLIDHLVPPSVTAELSGGLRNLHNEIEKWEVLEEGALKEKFRASITRQIQDAHLDRDLRVDRGKRPLFTPEQIERVESYLHQIHNQTTTVSLHVFGQPPPPDLLVPWLVTCLGKRFLDDLGEVVTLPPAAARSAGSRETFLRRKAEEVFHAIVVQGWPVEDALRAAGGSVPAAGLPKRLGEDFRRAKRLQDGFAKTHEEMDNLVAALAGRYIPPGPGNSPERNPAVVPTGRNMYVMNPEEVPSRPSWEIGKTLIDQLLAQQLQSKGRYPKKVAFTLNSFATFQDYGVMESQILYLLGVRPVWDDRNLVGDVELIPAAELRRPRIDVFIASGGYYRDMLPTRMHLLDKAIRMVAALDEPDNTVHRDSVQVRDELRRQGIEPRQAEMLSQARIFGVAPGQIGGTGYYYLVERSGQWNGRKDLMDTYLGFSRYVYTEGLWGKQAAAAYNRQIQGSEVVLRSWSDRTRSPLSNKYDWYIGGSLSLAIKQLTGKEPEWYLSDVRDADRAGLVAAEDALRRDYRVRLFNRKWIEGMMKEGYAGADQIAVHVSNTMGWAIMRDGSVSDDTWNEIAAVYVKDKLGLSLRQWFETQNPYAFQDMSEVLLESSRKGYWKGAPGLVREVAEQYARSVLRHGEGGGLRGGGNARLEQFVAATLRGAKSPDLDRLVAQYQSVLRDSARARWAAEIAGTAPGPGHAVTVAAAPSLPPGRKSTAAAAPAARPAAPTALAGAKKLEPSPAPEEPRPRRWPLLSAIAAAVLLLLAGFLYRKGMP
ncbi:MAG: cobaltochelatase subunit CobN [Thermoguttaceae bacterium]